jgi:hypothetical protein
MISSVRVVKAVKSHPAGWLFSWLPLGVKIAIPCITVELV